MDLIVKICGLSTEDTLDTALDAGADMVGFVFFAKSPRNIEVSRAAGLARRAAGRAEIAALTVDFDDSSMSALVEEIAPDWLQLHGRETPERVAEIRRRYGRQVMKAIGVAGSADLAAALAYQEVADRLLIDGRPPKGADRPGGHGATFDWTMLSGFDPDIPWLLAGGLTPGNVAEAIAATGAPGVDVSSGVETAPGVKDPALIRAFLTNARRGVAAGAREKVAS